MFSKNGKNGTNGTTSLNGHQIDLGELGDGDFPASPLGETHASLDELSIEFERSNEEGASDGSNGKYKREPVRYDYQLWNLGWTDGRLGQPIETNEAVLRSRVRLAWLRRARVAESRIANNKASANQLREALDKIQAKLELARRHFDELSQRRLNKYYESSYALAFVYLLVACVLFLSDVPLSLRLVAKGFDLKTQVLDPATNTVLISVDDLVKRPWQVFSNLWEPIVLALGIALAGVFIKFFLDELIFREDQEQKQPRKVKIVLWAILSIFLITLGLLGLFRAKVQSDLQESTFQLQKAALENRLRTQGLPQGQITDIAQSLRPPSQETGLAVGTFIALTVTLPLIGGVCFSAGWRRFKNARHFDEVKRDIRQLERKQDETLGTLNGAEGQVRTLEQWLTQLEQERKLGDPETEFYVNMYRHGYYRGINVPETIEAGEDLYTRSKRAVEKILAKKFQKRIWKDIRRDGQGEI
jgi:hypothetical protein